MCLGKIFHKFSLIKGQNAAWGYEKCAESIQKECANSQIIDFPHHHHSGEEYHLRSKIRGQPGSESAAPKVRREIKAWENKNSAFNWPGKSDPYSNTATQWIRKCMLIICLSCAFVQMYFLHMQFHEFFKQTLSLSAYVRRIYLKHTYIFFLKKIKEKSLDNITVSHNF